jgi:hypothetical protein
MILAASRIEDNGACSCRPTPASSIGWSDVAAKLNRDFRRLLGVRVRYPLERLIFPVGASPGGSGFGASSGGCGSDFFAGGPE